MSTSVDLFGLSDGPITATLSASDPAGQHVQRACIDASLVRSSYREKFDAPRLRMPTSVGPKRRASSLPSLGLNFDEMARSRSATAPYNVVVNIVNGAPVSTSVNLSGDEGRVADGVVVGERRSRQHVQRACIGAA